MGFGLCLVGYFLVNVLPVISVFSAAMLLGLPLLLLGLWRLAPYHKIFYYSFFFTLTGIPFGVYYTLYSFADVGVIPELLMLGGAVFAAVEWAYLVWGLIFHTMVLLGMAKLMTELGLFGFQSAAWRNLTFSLLYYFLFFLVKMPFMSAHAAPFIIPLTILRYLCTFLNLWLLFRSWQVILPEGSDCEPTESTPAGRRKA